MSLSKDSIIERARATRSAQLVIAALWVWEEQSVAQWTSDTTTFHAQQEIVAQANAAKNARAGTLEVELETLHQETMMILNLAKAKYRNNPLLLPSFKWLTANSNSRRGILDEALELESAWEKVDLLWSPLTGITFASFKASRLAVQALLELHSSLRAAWRAEAEKLNLMLAHLDDVSVAWYRAATAVFRPGTSEGDMIRGTIPTSSNPTPLPGQAVIAIAQSPESGIVSLSYEADHATSFAIFHKAPGAAEFVQIEEDVTELEFLHRNAPPGLNQYKVVGNNSTGSGAESETVTVMVV